MSSERNRRPHYASPEDSHKKMAVFSEIFLSSGKLVMVQSEHSWQPPTDVYETDNELVIKSELAGVKPEEVIISIDSDHVIIKGTRHEKSSAHIPGKRIFRQMEINYGKFERVIRMDGHVSPENAHAYYKDGFLEIVIPKSRQKRTIATIEIHFS
ncbi:MAG: Hsp20/alpha crystallin family protein [Candidatus Brocadiia bacterium]